MTREILMMDFESKSQKIMYSYMGSVDSYRVNFAFLDKIFLTSCTRAMQSAIHKKGGISWSLNF